MSEAEMAIARMEPKLHPAPLRIVGYSRLTRRAGQSRPDLRKSILVKKSAAARSAMVDSVSMLTTVSTLASGSGIRSPGGSINSI